MKKNRHSIEIVAALVQYNEATGKLYWKKRTVDMFKDSNKQTADAACKGFNTAYAGKEALACIGNHGYKHGEIEKKKYLAHHVCLAIYSGCWHKEEVDHINGIRTDNRAVNLRAVSRKENCRNKSMRIDNTSGHTGIDWLESRLRWRARITDKTIGYYKDLNQAISERAKAMEGRGFTNDHGVRVV